MEDETWCYLREEYYPQFRNNVVQLPWDVRFKLLRELYDAEGDLPWEIRSSDPVADMMNWVAKKGDEAYFTFFCKWNIYPSCKPIFYIPFTQSMTYKN